MRTLVRSAWILLTLSLAIAPHALRGQKTDWITLRNGNEVLGEIKELDRGLLEFSTSAMGTVRVEWPRVVTVNTDKIFEIALEDGTIYVGSVESGTVDSVVVRTDGESLTVATQSVVRLYRIKPTFWRALDGKVTLGFDFTQQNRKVDLDFGGEVWYLAGGSRGIGWRARGASITKLSFDATFSRQDGSDDIERLDGSLMHLRQYKGRWFYLGFLTASRNSQLSLDLRGNLGGGFGRLFIESNRMDLAVWVAPAWSRERFTGQSGANSFPVALAADFLVFIWEPLDMEITSQLAVLPILDQWGRWRIDFSLSAMKELVSNLNLNIGVNEAFDSRPPSVDANKNDLSFTTSLGWKF